MMSQAELFVDKVRNGLISISIRLADKTVKLNVLRRKCTEKAENVTKKILTLSVKRTPLIEVKFTPLSEVKHTPLDEVKFTPLSEVKHTPLDEVKFTPLNEVSQLYVISKYVGSKNNF